FISAEKHPLRKQDLARVLARTPGYAVGATLLLEQYPPLVAGFHRLTFDSGSVALTLLFSDVVDVLRELDAQADAFFLDGFAPARNPQMWSDAVFAELSRLAAPGATAATYTVAAKVRDGLRRAGFAVRKERGFGSKHQMLSACYEGPVAPAAPRIKPCH